MLQVPRLSGMLRAFLTQQGNVDIAGQYRQRASQLEERRQRAGDAHVRSIASSQPNLMWTGQSNYSGLHNKHFVLHAYLF